MLRKNRHRPPQSARSILQQIAQVVHNPDRERFELWVAGDLVGVLGYSTETVDGQTTITVLHTVLYDEYSGHGLATRLTRTVIHFARERNARLRPVCSFTKNYLDRHPGIVPLAPV
ncbi:GNAT family N-acetyltransferase [Gordonia rubripertincta]|uniref:N-acetyltransferase n=2 Tax=Gordonia rubripertincta TaxID=36822 RepID=A0AAW6R8P3_GORRU|nr:GNAT family N-acetyltransferase [Gordonia rubripertincta]MBM7280411.1 N-acetyltransferase [Gordonia rubripertincta]MDG6780993.1 GNAT family N-acetyltransferase [Gordonia rubripertincta]NKY66002.1 N-acetyltransferase [Gordonia rubripertincta]QMU22295.1 N-acetyltransferase [Gordonia rubripertincta]TSD92977.1 N-acetyltransferase [Gordonia rubripertincta]